jgi:hypothetical protein
MPVTFFIYFYNIKTIIMNKKFIIFLVCISAAMLLSTSCKQKKGGSGLAYTLKNEIEQR